MSVLRKKFDNYLITAKGEKRAFVDMHKLQTLWINTGTLCNIECLNCYIESSPRNDRLSYITHAEVVSYLDEIREDNLGTGEIGITGGEPFMNREMISIMEEVLSRGFNMIVLTNAMRPMMRFADPLLEINKKYKSQLTMRVSVDHYDAALHEEERGKGTWEPMLKGLQWLSDNDFTIDIAGRTRWHEDEKSLRDGYAAFFKQYGIHLDAYDEKALVLFPEMDEKAEVPEITESCWGILGISPSDIMCANSRMVVKRKGEKKPSVVACTLLPYDREFEYASTLKDSTKRTYLNHPHCAKFCVLGGGTCRVKGDEE